MPGLIRRTLLIGGVAAAAGGVALWRLRRPGGVELEYGGDPAQLLDVAYPRATDAAPVLVIFHGGDFATGDKDDVTVWPEWLEAGIAVVRVNTRTSDQAKWPTQADDALAAVVHLQRNGAELGLDPARMVLMGQGAGAYLAVNTALSLVEVGLPPKGVVSLYVRWISRRSMPICGPWAGARRGDRRMMRPVPKAACSALPSGKSARLPMPPARLRGSTGCANRCRRS